VTDILRKLSAQFDTIFGRKPESQVANWPPHIRELVSKDVERIGRRIRTEFAEGLPHTLELELSAWLETRTVNDGRRVATALRHYGLNGLADEIRELIGTEEAK
jgi:hypothetical protein